MKYDSSHCQVTGNFVCAVTTYMYIVLRTRAVLICYFLLTILSVDRRDAYDNIGYCGAVQQKQLSVFHAVLQVHDRCIGEQCTCAHPTGTNITTVCFQNTRLNETMSMFSGGFWAM